MSHAESTITHRGSLLPRRGAEAVPTRAPGRIRRAIATQDKSIPVAEDYRGFTLDRLAATVDSLRAQGIAGDTQLVAKVGDHPFNDEVPDVHLVAILALRVVPPADETEGEGA